MTTVMADDFVVRFDLDDILRGGADDTARALLDTIKAEPLALLAGPGHDEKILASGGAVVPLADRLRENTGVYPRVVRNVEPI